MRYILVNISFISGMFVFLCLFLALFIGRFFLCIIFLFEFLFMAVIVVSNTSNIARSEILTIKDSDHVFAKNESMKAWIESGEEKEKWSRLTTLVYVTDKTKSEIEFLLEPLIDFNQTPPTKISNKYHFQEPDPANEIWIEMYQTGETHQPFAVIEQFLVERT